MCEINQIEPGTIGLLWLFHNWLDKKLNMQQILHDNKFARNTNNGIPTWNLCTGSASKNSCAMKQEQPLGQNEAKDMDEKYEYEHGIGI